MGASASQTGPLAGGGAAKASPAKPSVPSAALEDFEDFLWNAIMDSMDMDWSCTDGARSIIRALDREGRLVPVLQAFAGDAQ